jgi:hypothetical protein
MEGLCKTIATSAYVIAVGRDKGVSKKKAIAFLDNYKNLDARDRHTWEGLIEGAYANPDATPEMQMGIVLTLCMLGRI